MASRAGLSKAVIAALEEGADIDAPGCDDWNALGLATFYGHYTVVKILVALGADPHVLIEKGATLLMYAAMQGHANIGEYLISLGVPIDVVDGDGDSAMSVAKRCGHEKFIAMLEKYIK
jgi:ankyrin repeat protein